MTGTEHRTEKKKMTHGGRNLVVLGVVTTVIAIVTTGVSLLIYHNSGDIYLDRSRPGYLPDEEEIEGEGERVEEEYVFEKTGKLTMNVIEEYLEKLKVEVKAIDEYERPFNEDVLSDEWLGIPNAETQDDMGAT